MASPLQSEQLKYSSEPLQHHMSGLDSNGKTSLLQDSDSFVTPPRRRSAKAGATPYPDVRKPTPRSEVTSASPLKGELAGVRTVAIPVMQGIKVLIEEKEKELTALSERRVKGVEAQAKSLAEDLRRKEAEIATLQSQLSQLTSDFKYNLKLLDERDAELEKQDQELLAFRKSVAGLEAQLHEVRRGEGQWREEAERMRQRVEEMEEAIGAYQEVVAKVRDQLEDAKRLRDEEVAKQAAETGVLKAHLGELNAQHEADVEAAVQRAEESFQAERIATEKRVSEMRSKLEEGENRRREEVRSLQAEVEVARNKGNERVAEEREKGKREVQKVQKTVDETSVRQLKLEEEHRTKTELLRKQLGAEYQAALLRLQKEHGADVSARVRAFEREREALERQAGAWEEERLTLAARLEAAEREARGAGVKWEERVRALQEERKQGEQQTQALQARVTELEGLTSAQSAELENAQRQSRMLQALVDDLHAALQAKEEATRGLQKRLDELEGANVAAVAALERDKAEAEASLRQQLLGEYEAKVAELLDALRTMEEHVASESDATSQKLAEQVEAHGREVERLEGLLEGSRRKVEGLEIECREVKEERERERDDAQFVKSTLAARDAEVELLRGEVESIQKEVENLSEERTVRTQEEKVRTEEASALRVELSAREAEVVRLAEMLENARHQAEGLGLEVAQNDGLGFGTAGRSVGGFGGLGADGFALVRKLAAENEELRRRLLGAEATTPNAVPNPGGLTDGPGAHEGLLKSRTVRRYSRDEVRTVSGFADGEEESRGGELGQREGLEEPGLGRLGFGEQGFVTDSGPPMGLQVDPRRSSSPAIAKLQQEMRAVRQTVAALRSSHVAAVDAISSDGRHVSHAEGDSQSREARRAPRPPFADGRNFDTSGPMEELATLRNELLALGLEVTAVRDAREISSRPEREDTEPDPTTDSDLHALGNELLQLKAVVQSLAAPETGRTRVEAGDRRNVFREGKKSENQSGQRAAQTDAVTIGVLQQMKESVAALRAEVASLQRAEVGAVGRQQVDAPFANPVAGLVGEFRAGVNPGRLSEPTEGFSGGFGTPIALTGRDAHLNGEALKLRQQVTSAGTAADVAALQESVAQLTRDLLALRSGAAPLGSGSGSAHGVQQLVTSGLTGKASGGQVFATKAGEVWTEGEEARNDLRGPERNSPMLVPSELLQREIAEAQAELAALRSGSKAFPALGTERDRPESGSGLVIEGMEVSKEGRSSVRWADGESTEGVEPSERVSQEATGNSVWGSHPGQARGIPRGPLLTWTDLATCLEHSENEPGRERFVLVEAASVGSGRNGASVRAAQRVHSVEKLLVKNARENAYISSKPFSYSKKWGQSSGTAPLRTAKSAAEVPPHIAINAAHRKEKQNKVGDAPKLNRANPTTLF
ncbi:hypothetical protein KFL_002660160 [Klebsormidium nitens]|uniref:Uncharacterized protein n=1 Tax=Klebsormidium nitens TaxID=105231 RepID=A0A1Y1IBE0_KLENI|nr:hypothetical protein KFL_002660160 [Klebsormidium nitens]|eukprot:GAQ86037.1 hypothetical protein KFL_002660160 [Klebsormidium nitens]